MTAQRTTVQRTMTARRPMPDPFTPDIHVQRRANARIEATNTRGGAGYMGFAGSGETADPDENICQHFERVTGRSYGDCFGNGDVRSSGVMGALMMEYVACRIDGKRVRAAANELLDHVAFYLTTANDDDPEENS